MHAFVLRFFQERMDPAAIAFDAAQGTQMLQRAPTIPGTAATVSRTTARWPYRRAKKASAKNRISRVKA